MLSLAKGSVTVPVSPVCVLDVVLDEGQDVWDDVVLAAGGEQHHADPRGLVRVPVVFVVKLLLNI